MCQNGVETSKNYVKTPSKHQKIIANYKKTKKTYGCLSSVANRKKRAENIVIYSNKVTNYFFTITVTSSGLFASRI